MVVSRPVRHQPLRRRLAAPLLAAALVAGCATGGERAPATDSAAGSDGAAGTETLFGEPDGVAYEVAFEGAGDGDLEEVMRGASHLIALADRPPASMTALRRRAAEDAGRMVEVLRSRGYYAGRVRAEVSGSPDDARVMLHVVPGAVYLLGDYAVRFVETEDPEVSDLMPTLKAMGLHIGMFADADAIVAAESVFTAHYREHGYPAARIVDRAVRVDHARTLVEVELAFAPGPRAAFGAVVFEGLSTVDAAYLRRLIPWRVGDRFASSRLEQYRRRLRETGLFASVRADVGTAPDPRGRVPARVTVEEAPSRSIGAGASYSTSEGPGGKVFWEHRNLHGANERLRLAADGNTIEQTVDAEFRKPAFLRAGQNLLALGELSRVDSDAYEEIGIGLRAGLERLAGPHWRTGLFGTFEVARITDDGGKRVSKLFGLPVEIEHDTSDDLLDPTGGNRLGLYVTPHAGHADESLLFGVVETRGAVYRKLDDEGTLVAAARARIGGIVGENRLVVPANKRFYAGGGGSIRGYEYQIVGPLDGDGDPEGGRSVVEVGAELRIRLFEDFGLVPFVDGGQTYGNAYPNFGDALQWAAGLGARYYTPIGPLRLDVAFPLNGRKDIDETFQLYVSLGQAF